jgi:ATP-binding cassette subfamily B protein
MNFPFYKQLESADCGATCLRIILKYFGKTVSAHDLKEICETGKDGVSILDISDAANLYKLKTVSGCCKVEDLNSKNLPCILFWKRNHFVVLYKIRKNKNGNKIFYIAEPAKGLIKLLQKEFSDCWLCMEGQDGKKGVVLLLKPTTEFYQITEEKAKKVSLSFIFRYILRYKQLIIQLIIGLLTGCLLQLVLPFLTQLIVDIGISNHDINFIYLILIGQFLLLIGRVSVDFFRRWILLHISSKINILLLSAFVSKLLKFPLGFFDSKQTGDLLQRINDHERECFIDTINLLGKFDGKKSLSEIFNDLGKEYFIDEKVKVSILKVITELIKNQLLIIVK